MNVLPSEAEVGFDIRLPPTEDPAVLSRRVSDEWAPSSRNMTFQVRNLVWIKTLLDMITLSFIHIAPNSASGSR